MDLFILIYSLIFLLLALQSFRLAVGLFIIGLPAYLIRFKIGPLPTTLLEVNFGILFLVWLLKFARRDVSCIVYHVSRNRFLFSCFLVFLFSSVLSIFVSDMWYYSLGQWRAYFLEPMLVFMMLLGRIVNTPPSPLSRGESSLPPKKEGVPTESGREVLAISDLLWFLALSTVSISLFGILQRFTGWHIGNVDWIALQTGRVTSFFLSPNAVGLYLGPIIPLIFFLAIKYRSQKTIYYLLFTILLFAGLALALSKSLGAIVAAGLGALLFIYLVGYKKTTLASLLIIISLLVVNIQYPISNILDSKSQSLGNRLTLWSYSWNYLTASPKNFVFGTGIRQFFRKIQKPYYDVKKMERLIYPHNIFLNFWTEIGFIGMASFALIAYCLVLSAIKIYQHFNKILGASLLAALVTILLHGLIDVPYFKNDLSMIFWIVAALVIQNNTIGVAESKA